MFNAAPDAEFHSCRKACVGCPFGGPKIGSKGNAEAPIVIVAEGPTNNDIVTRNIFTGPLGEILGEIIPKNSPDVLYLYSMECRSFPQQQTEGNYAKAFAACGSHIRRKILEHPRRIVIALGNVAVGSLTGISPDKVKVTKIRGTLLQSDLARFGIMPALHPNALQHATGNYRQWKLDIQKALDIGLGGVPEQYVEAQHVLVPPDASEDTIKSIMSIIEETATEPGDITADIETSGLDYITDDILMLAVSSNTHYGYIFTEEYQFQILKPYLESACYKWAWHNGKFDVKFFKQRGIEARVDEDTMLMSYALDENGGIHDLDQVALDALNAPRHKDMLKPYLPNKKTSYSVIPKPILAKYAGIDTAKTHGIRRKYRKRVAANPILDRLYSNIMIPASDFLTWLEMNGIYVDTDKVEENAAKYTSIINAKTTELCALYGKEINPNSPQQVAVMLYDHFKFPDLMQRSTSKDAILGIRKRGINHPALACLSEIRKAAKLYGTYIKSLWNPEDPGNCHRHLSDGRVHCTFKIHGTKTGRLASADPNMQNQPRLAEIKGQFIAAPGYELVEVDLSQAELRVLAVASGDPILLKVFADGKDLHADLAEFLFPGWEQRSTSGDPVLEAIAKEQRVKCKNVNFGIIYGITAFGLFDQMGGSVETCQSYIDGWFARYKVAAKFIETCRNTPLTNQVITTIYGRMKRLGVVSPQNIGFLQNEAANFPEQSIASDITLTAGIALKPKLIELGIRIVNIIHDALLMEIPITPNNELRERAIIMGVKALEASPLKVGLNQIPFIAEAEYGTRWGNLSKVKVKNGKVVYGKAA